MPSSAHCRERCAADELTDALVLALPRGGVPVAAEIASAFDLELDVIVVRKLGVPGHEELAMGAIASGDVVVRNHDVIDGLGISERTFDDVLRRERAELLDREAAPRQDAHARPPALADRTSSSSTTVWRRGRRCGRRSPRSAPPARGGSSSPSRSPRPDTAAELGGDRRPARLSAHPRPVRCGRRCVRRLLPDVRRRGPPAAATTLAIA